MADRKAVNKYYPPDWRPEMGSINKYRNSHPLRDRARKLDQGILIIRFEMPFNIWCDGCGNHVGMGVRYNAEKKKVGNYYTTPIFNFNMKCHLCDNRIEMENDPENCDYKVVKGASRKNERWEGSEGSISIDGKDEKRKLMSNAMYKLEHDVGDAETAQQAAPSLEKLERHMDVWKDDFSANKLLRDKFRKNKAVIKQQALEDDKLKKKFSIDVSLLEENDEDKMTASRIRFHKRDGIADSKKKRRFEIKSSSIFNSPNGAPSIKKDSQKLNLLNKKLKHSLDHHKFTPIATAETKAKFLKSAVDDVASSLVKRKVDFATDSNKRDCHTENSVNFTTKDDLLMIKENTSLNALTGYESDTDSNSNQENT